MNIDSLKRQLGFWDSVAIIIGIVIGVGIFRVPAEIAKYLEHPALILSAWAAGGVISILGVLCYAELSSCYPQTGGTYVYLREAYGKLTAFLFGWMEIAVLRAGSMAGVAYVFAAYMKNMFEFGPGTEKIIAVLAIVFFTLVNISGLRYGTGVQNVLSTLKVLTLLGISAAIFLNAGSSMNVEAAPVSRTSPWIAFAPALIPVLWTYGGWHESTFMSGEFRDTHSALPKSLITSVLLITALYLCINSAYLMMMNADTMAQSKSIASDIFMNLFGRTGQVVISLAVLISASGALNSYILTGARVPFAVAGDLPRIAWLGRIHLKYDTPVSSFIFNAAWAALLVLWGNFEDLLFFTGFAKWLFFFLAGISVFILRKKAGGGDGYQMIGYPWVPVIFSLISAALFITTLYHAPRASLFGGLLLFAGFPVYFLLRGKVSR